MTNIETHAVMVTQLCKYCDIDEIRQGFCNIALLPLHIATGKRCGKVGCMPCICESHYRRCTLRTLGKFRRLRICLWIEGYDFLVAHEGEVVLYAATKSVTRKAML